LHIYYDRVTARNLTSPIDSYACRSLDDGRATHARQVLNEVRTRNRCPGPPGWEFGLRLTFANNKNSVVSKTCNGETMNLKSAERHRRRRRKII
jgi:hypothetical protein